MEQVKLLSTTAILTLLIWMAADSLVRQKATLSIALEVTPATSDSSMILTTDPADRVVEVEVSGPRKSVERIQALAPLTARLRVSELQTGLAQITLDGVSIKTAMQERYFEFRKLNVLSLRRSTLPVVVDRIVRAEATIVLRQGPLVYDVEPQSKRSSVMVRLRESRLKECLADNPDGQLTITAEVDRLFRDQAPGQDVTIPLSLDARQFGQDAALDPDTVLVSATVRAERSTEKIPTVPILIAVSPANLAKAFRPVSRDGAPLELLARTITVTGPMDEIAKLVRGETRAYGVIRLRQDDLQNLGTLKLFTPDYHLPPGVSLAEPPELVEFKLVTVGDHTVTE